MRANLCRLAVALGLFFSFVALSPALARPVPSPCPLNVVPRDPGWTSIEAPDFTQNPLVAHTMAAELFGIVPGERPVLLAASTNEIFKSNDEGCSWRKVFTTTDDLFVDCNHLEDAIALTPSACGQIFDLDVAADNSIYAQVRGIDPIAAPPMTYIFVSRDGGDTWDLFSQVDPLMSFGQGDLATAPGDPGTIYVERGHIFDIYEEAHALFVTHDGGATWSQTPLPGGLDRVNSPGAALVVSARNSKEVWTLARVFRTEDPGHPTRRVLVRSMDAGQTWDLVTNPATDLDTSVQSFAIHESGRVAVSNETTVFASLDGGQTWAGMFGELSAGEGYVEVVLGRNGQSLFGVGEAASVVLHDFKRGAARLIKSRSYGNGIPGVEAWWTYGNPRYLQGLGFFILGSCDAGWESCQSLYRYQGKGT